MRRVHEWTYLRGQRADSRSIAAGAEMREMHGKMEQLHAETLVITDRSNAEAAKLANAIVLPLRLGAKRHRPEELYTAIPYIIPAQLLAAKMAEEKGLDPDQPRTICASEP